ncbi:MAG: ATP-binding protein, partial [Bacteroidota bacterium]
RINNNHQAIQYFQIALNVKERTNSDVTATLINLAHSYRALGKDDKAFSYYEQVIVLCQEYCEPEFLAGARNGAGLFHFKKKDLDKAKYEFEEAVKVSKMHGLPLREVIALHNLSKIALQSNNIKLALDHVNESQSIALSYGYKNWIRFNYKLFGAIYFQLNSFELAYEYQNKSDSLNEIIEGSEVRSKIAILEREIEEREKSLLQEKEARALKSRNQLFIGSSAGIVFLGGMVFFFYRSNRFRKRANKQISKTLEELKTTQDQLVAQEKMAALGQLISGIAHEINTPLGAIQGLIQPVNDHFAFVTSQLNEGLKLIPEAHHTLILGLMKHDGASKPQFTAQERKKQKTSLNASLTDLGIPLSKPTIAYLLDLGVIEPDYSWSQLLKLPNHEVVVKLIHSVVMHERGTRQMETVVNKIAKMVSALQTYSQPERLAEVKVAIDLRENIDQVLVLLENEFKQGVQLIKKYPETLPTIQGNPEALSQVWTNLLLNAIQAVEGEGTVEVEIEEKEDKIMVSIKDDGYGIKEEVREKIFEAFYTTKKRGYGTGLGLNIAKKIMSNHKGMITLITTEGQTFFQTSLPVATG